MDIVSDLPFTLKLIQNYPIETIQEARVFCKEEQDIWKNYHKNKNCKHLLSL